MEQKAAVYDGIHMDTPAVYDGIHMEQELQERMTFYVNRKNGLL